MVTTINPSSTATVTLPVTTVSSHESRVHTCWPAALPSSGYRPFSEEDWHTPSLQGFGRPPLVFERQGAVIGAAVQRARLKPVQEGYFSGLGSHPDGQTGSRLEDAWKATPKWPVVRATLTALQQGRAPA
jgi:hypothetical protein